MEERSSQPDFSAPADKLRGSFSDAGEQRLWRGNYSPKAMYGTWLAAAAATLLGLVAVLATAVGSGTAWLVWLGLTILVWCGLGGLYLYRRFDRDYELTSQRFVHREGVLSRVSHRIEVIDIDDVACQQGLIERLVGVGTIILTSSDRSHPELKLPGIDDVQQVTDLIDEVRRAERRRRGLHIEAI